MFSVRILFLFFSLFVYLPLAHASMADDAGLNEKCETFLDRAAKKLGVTVPAVRSHLNLAVLSYYKPRTTLQRSSLEEVAYGDAPVEIMEKLSNFVGDSILKSSSEVEEIRAGVVADMIAQFLPDWRREKVWFFEASEELSLFKEGDMLPTKFLPGSFVIMRGGYALGRAELGEIDKIDWL